MRDMWFSGPAFWVAEVMISHATMVREGGIYMSLGGKCILKHSEFWVVDHIFDACVHLWTSM